MARTGHDGSHSGCLATGFVSSYVAPLVATVHWNPELVEIAREVRGGNPILASASE